MVSKKNPPAKKSVPVKKADAAKKVVSAKKAAGSAKQASSAPAAGHTKPLPYMLDVVGSKLVIRPAGGGNAVELEKVADLDGATLTLVLKLRDPPPTVAVNGDILDALNTFLKKRAAAGIEADVTTTIPSSSPPAAPPAAPAPAPRAPKSTRKRS